MMKIPQFCKNDSGIPTQLTEKMFNEFFCDLLPIPKRGLKSIVPRWRIFNYILKILHTGSQWKELQIVLNPDGSPEISYSRVFKIYKNWLFLGVFGRAFDLSVKRLLVHGLVDTSVIYGDGTTTAAKKGGDQIEHNGHRKMKGEKVVAFIDRLCNMICLFTTAPGNDSEMKLFLKAFDDLKSVCKRVGISLRGTIASLDSGYDRKANRKLIFNTEMRFRTVERVFVWEDKFKRLLIRFERYSIHHFGMKLLAYTLINLRHFCE